MKLQVFLTILILLTFSSASTVATYHGQMEKQGPKANFVVGFASDEPARITLSAENKSGINITFKQNHFFLPDEAPRRIQRGKSQLPLQEFSVKINSGKPQKTVYEIPVVLRAYSNGNRSGSTAPKLVNEREYVFRYRTQISPDYGLEGSLINSTDKTKESEGKIPQDNSSENTIINENKTKTSIKEEKEPGSSTTLLLALGVLLVFSYTIYEAMT